jgi:uncharacterized membrane protein YhaH (DUF805 family)
MGFGQAISTCFRKYVTFSGRAPRSEYWYFVLFSILIQIPATILDSAFSPAGSSSRSGPVSALLSLVLLLPSLAVTVRRLHDTNRSGFWILAFYGVIFVGVIIFLASLFEGIRTGALSPTYAIGLFALILGAGIWMIVWLAQRGTSGPNKYGPDPFGPDVDVFR